MKRLLRLIVFTALLLPAGAWGEGPKLYKYVDDQGVTHFTDNMESIPEKYHSSVKQADAIVSKTGSETPTAQKPAPDAAQEPEKTPEEIAETQQRAEYEELKAREKELTEQLEQMDEEVSRAARLKSKSGKDMYNWKQLKQQKEAMEQELKVTQERMLEIEPAD